MNENQFRHYDVQHQVNPNKFVESFFNISIGKEDASIIPQNVWFIIPIYSARIPFFF